MLILLLQQEGKDIEAFTYFEKMPDEMMKCLDHETLISMLVAVDKETPVKNLLARYSKEDIDKKLFARSVVLFLSQSLDNVKKFIRWINEMADEKALLNADRVLYLDACVDALSSLSKGSISNDKLSDALDFIDTALDLVAVQEKIPTSTFFTDKNVIPKNIFGMEIDRKQLIKIKEIIISELKVDAEWATIKSDAELFKFNLNFYSSVFHNVFC